MSPESPNARALNMILTISTPSYPGDPHPPPSPPPKGGRYVNNTQPNFNWIGPSTSVVAGLEVGSQPGSYILEVSSNDLTFNPSNVVINVSTPAVVASTMVAAADGAYISTYTLTDATTYYWRVRVIDNSGPRFGSWSGVYKFVTDFTSPTASGFTSFNSTGGAIGESQWNNLMTGVTVQINVQDLISGLAVSTGALAFGGDGHDGAQLTSGYGVMYSTNAGQTWQGGSTWVMEKETIETQIRSLAVFNGRLYAGTGDGGKIYSSADGSTWEMKKDTTESRIWSLAVFNGKLYAGTEPNGKIYSSADGSNWDMEEETTESCIWSLAVFNGKLYAGTSSSGTIYSSADGSNWEMKKDTTESNIHSLAVFNGKLYAGGDGKIYSSADGNTWEMKKDTTETEIRSLAVFNGRLYAGTGTSGKIYSSADGSNWSEEEDTTETYIRSLAVFNGKLYAGTAEGGKIYSSVDGSNWDMEKDTTETHILSLAVFNGKLYAGTQPNGKIFSAADNAGLSLTGSDGTIKLSTLTASNLDLVQSTNTETCNGSDACGATNQVIFTVSDMAGNVKKYGPFAVLVDTMPPSIPEVSTMSIAGTAPLEITVGISTSADNSTLSAAPYQIQISTKESMSILTGDSGWISTTYYTFAGLPGGNTYYARTRSKDSANNVSVFSSTKSLYTSFVLHIISEDVAPLNVYQSSANAFIRLDMWTDAGVTSWSKLVIRSSGTAINSDVGDVGVYVNSFPGVRISPVGTGFVNGKVDVTITPVQNIGVSTITYFIMVMPSSNAVVGRNTGVYIDKFDDFALSNSFAAYGVFPASSSLANIQYGASELTVSSYTSAVSYDISQGAQDQEFLKVDLTAGVNSIQLTGMEFVRQGGDDSDVDRVRVYRDINSDGIYNPGSDLQMTEAVYKFEDSSATVNFSVSQSSQTLAAGTTVVFFVTADISNASTIGHKFRITMPSTSCFLTVSSTNSVSSLNIPVCSTYTTIYPVVADVTPVVPPTPEIDVWTTSTTFIFDGHLKIPLVRDRYYVKFNQSAEYNITTGDTLYTGPAGAYSTNTATADGLWYFHARAYTAGEVGGTQVDIGPYKVDVNGPQGSNYLTYNSTHGVILEPQWNNLSAGVTVQIAVQDWITGLAYSTGSYRLLYSTNAGASWVEITSTQAASGSYVEMTGAEGSVNLETMTVYGLNLVQSTNTETCDGNPCGATNQLKFAVTDLLGNEGMGGPYAVLVDTTSPSNNGVASMTVSTYVPAVLDVQVQEVQDALSGLAATPYNISVSTDVNFIEAVHSSDWIFHTTYSVNGVLPGETYYVRSWAKDNAGNISEDVDSIEIPFVMNVVIQDTAPANAYQSDATGMLKLVLNTDSETGHWNGIKLHASGTAQDSDVSEVAVYLGSVIPINKVSGSGLTFVDGVATLNIPAPQVIGTSGCTYYIAVKPSPNAVSGKTVAASIFNGTEFMFTDNYRVYTVESITSSPSTIQYGTSTLTVSSFTASLPANVSLGQKLAVLRLDLEPSPNSIQISSIAVTGMGSLDTAIFAAGIYKDADDNKEFDSGIDTLLTSGVDAFINNVSTMQFTASMEDSTFKAGQTTSIFVVIDIANTAVVDSTFSLRINGPESFFFASARNSTAVDNLPAYTSSTTVQSVVANVTPHEPPTPPVDVWTSTTAFIFDGHIGTLGVDHYYYKWNQTEIYSVDDEDDYWSGPGSYSTNTATLDGLWYFHARAYTSGGVAGTQADLGPYKVDFNAPTVWNFLTYNSTGGVKVETQWNNLSAGVTTQVTVQDDITGLTYEFGSYKIEYSKDAGSSWTAISSTQTTEDYVSLSGAEETKVPQVLDARSLNMVESTNTETCGGAPCGATNQVKFIVTDVTGNTQVSGPWAVLVDITQPTANVASFNLPGLTLNINASGNDALSNLRDYEFQLSTTSGFAGDVTSSGFKTLSNHSFGGLLEAVTYYARVFSRDNAFNVSEPSTFITTATTGNVWLSTTNVAPASVLQGEAAAFLKLSLHTDPGYSTKLSSLKVKLVGEASQSDIISARLYLDTNKDGTFKTIDDTELGNAAFSGIPAEANIILTSPWPITSVADTFFVVYYLDPQATTAKLVGAYISQTSDLGIPYPYKVFGPAPIESSHATIEDGINTLNFTPTQVAPAIVPPNTPNVNALKLTAQTDVGTSILEKLVLRLEGTLPSNQISAVNIYRDANANGNFDFGDDTLLTFDSDVFVDGISTLSFTGASQDSRTMNTAPAHLFIITDVAAGATEGTFFSVVISTSADFTLSNPGDTVEFSTTPIKSTDINIQTSNIVIVSMEGTAPAEFTQGIAYEVLKASLTVDVGVAQLHHMKVNLIGNNVDEDVAAVKVYLDQVKDGLPWNPAVDIISLGSGSFVEPPAGVAEIDIDTVTLTAGTTEVLFIVYEVSPSANAGNELGISITNQNYFSIISPFTSVEGNFPAWSSTGTIKATINTLTIDSAFDMTTGDILQGAQNAAILKLTVRSNLNPITWSALELIQPGTSEDVDAVKIYLDLNDDGSLDPGDTLITSGLDKFSGGYVNLALSVVQSVDSSVRSYFVAFDVAPDAVLGETLGLTIVSSSAFSVNIPNLVSTAPVPFPITVAPMPIKQYPNIITVSTESIVPGGGVYPGASNVPLMKLRLNTDVSAAQWLQIQIDRAGSISDEDVTSIRIYYDVNSLDTFDSAHPEQYLLVSTDTLTFGEQGSPGRVWLDLEPVQGLDTAPKTYFIAVDISTETEPGKMLEIRALTKDYFTMNLTNRAADGSSFVSDTLDINAPSSTLYAVFENHLGAQVVQGQSSVLIASFTLTVSAYEAYMYQLDMNRLGVGYNKDISAIKLYRDKGDGTWGGTGDESFVAGTTFSGGAASFVFSGEKIEYLQSEMYFIVADISYTAEGSQFGISLPTKNYLRVTSPDVVDPFSFDSAIADIKATIDTMEVNPADSSPQAWQGDSDKVIGEFTVVADQNSVSFTGLRLDQNGTAGDSDISVIRVYTDDGDTPGVFDSSDTIIGQTANINNGTANMVFSSPQVVSQTVLKYFVTIDVAQFAEVGATVEFTAFTNYFAVETPDIVSVIGDTATFSIVGTIADSPDKVYVSFEDEMSGSLYQGKSETPVARLGFRTDNDEARMKTVKLSMEGSALPGDISSVNVYDDADVVVASATAISSPLNLEFSPLQLITPATRYYRVTVDISPGAVIDNTLGFTIPNASFIILTGNDATADFAGYATTIGAIKDPRVPTPPVIETYRADGEVSIGAISYSPYETQLKFRWDSQVYQGYIEQAFYNVGAAPGVSTSTWESIGTARETRVSGLELICGGTYYLSLKIKNTLGAYISDIVSRKFVVDSFVPGAPGDLTSRTEDDIVSITWQKPPIGPSGIYHYIVEERSGSSPQWEVVSITTGRTLRLNVTGGVASSHFNPLSLSRAPGTYFYRVTVVNNAGVTGTPSGVLRVNMGIGNLAALTDVSAYPNPFDSRKRSVTINFTLNQDSPVEIQIYDVFGSKVRKINASGVAGSNDIYWDGADSSGRKVSKGVYIGVIKAVGDKKVLKIGVIH